MNLIINFIVIIVFIESSFAYPADEILNLPGLNKSEATFKQYSGYLSASSDRHYHYWFVESQSNPAKDPVILWLNGGPGASSLIGFWSENGPFRVEKDGKTLVKHPHSWNTLANVLYLESPAGVGYSYLRKQIIFDDNITAEDNYRVLNMFFLKFPQFAHNPFYMTGESYAGVYLPMLALKIYENKSIINLKGVAIGNGALDFHMFFNSMVRIVYTHGLIGSSEYNKLVHNCCNCTANAQVCDFANSKSPRCNPAKMIRNMISRSGINPYNIYSDCKPPKLYSIDSHYNRALNKYFGIEFEEIEKSFNKMSSNTECESEQYANYMSKPEVRVALHIPSFLPNWGRTPINYNIAYGSMKSQFKELIEKHKIPNLIVYNGDIDTVCDFLGDQQFVDELGYKLTQKYKKWSVGGRTAGFIKRYEGITFMTVRNAGHMVPTDQPEAALSIIKELIGISKVDQ